MRTRNWSIRSKIIALVAVPLTALLALWVFATVLTVGPALNLLSAQTLLDTVGNPGEVLFGELQAERRQSVVFLSDPGATLASLATQRAASDRAIADFRRAAGGPDAQRAASDTLRARISQVFTELNNLPGNRDHIDRRAMDVVGAQGLYNSVIDAGFRMFSATATFNDERVDREIRALTTIGRGQEYLSRADSMLAGANAAGKLTEEVRGELISAIATARFLLSDGVVNLAEQDRFAFQKMSRGEAFSRLGDMQNTLITDSLAGAPAPVSGTTWQPWYDASKQQLRAFEINATDSLADRATPVAITVLVRLGLAGVVGLLALIISIIVSVKVGRSLVGRLVRLRREALEMAGERLPTVIRRLQRGEVVDVDVETPPLEYGSDEVGQLGHAFNEVQRTAVQSAVEEASVRRGINEVFLNIARRSQTLLHRQLALLDRMERRETEPEELEDLYRVDHLATRMRRHAEDLVILAGAAPGRGWRNPVPLIDVVRGAISEVEDYKRVDIRAIESSAVLGRAVGDVIHLLAELLENAASFSPPRTRVQVTGQILPNGYAVEIEDRGLGMSPEAVDEANRRLREPPDFDPADSARLGLFVVAQLANRHSIRVSLRRSVYGGVTAVVLIPGELISTGTGPAALPAGPSAADKSWDRPLVGTGTDDPNRRSLAALQWQGTAELRSLPMPGRGVTINGSATLADPAAGSPASSVVDGIGADGLAQRRRLAPRRPASPSQPTAYPAGLDSPPGLFAPRSPGASGPPNSSNGRELRVSGTPAAFGPPVAGPAAPQAVPPVPSGPARSAPALPPTEDGLPRRVRQASLAPQLRHPAPEVPDTAPTRSPEEVRTLMNALQRGTARGRLEAVTGRTGNGASTGNGTGADPAQGTSFAEAATVSFPAVQISTDPPGSAAPARHDDAGHQETIDENHVTRPEKDA